MSTCRNSFSAPDVRRLLRAFLATCALTVSAVQVAAQTAYPGSVWQPGPAEYGSSIVQNETVTMEDGVALATIVAYPTDLSTGQRAEGRFPVIVEFTPYVRLGAPIAPNTYFTERGYIYAVVRPRGTGGSEGEVQQFSSRDGKDGVTIVHWAAKQLEAGAFPAVAKGPAPSAWNETMRTLEAGETTLPLEW
jgi:uncharacterized protein